MLWNMVLLLCSSFPWLLIAGAAGLLLSKRKKSRPLMAQALGACGAFLLRIAEWIVLGLLSWSGVRPGIYDFFQEMFAVVLWICFFVFLVGYCWEKLVQWRETKMVPAVPVP